MRKKDEEDARTERDRKRKQRAKLKLDRAERRKQKEAEKGTKKAKKKKDKKKDKKTKKVGDEAKIAAKDGAANDGAAKDGAAKEGAVKKTAAEKRVDNAIKSARAEEAFLKAEEAVNAASKEEVEFASDTEQSSATPKGTVDANHDEL